MALINCPDCGRQVSDKAAACPNCACPISGAADARPAAAAAPGAGAPAAESEKTVWAGSPSQLRNTHVFLLCMVLSGALVAAAVILKKQGVPFTFHALAALLPLVALIILVRWVGTSSVRYELTTERIRLSRGVLSKTFDEIELYRVKDATLTAPLVPRLFGLGYVTVVTSDKSTPVIVVGPVGRAKELREELRRHVETCRTRRGVREVDME